MGLSPTPPRLSPALQVVPAPALILFGIVSVQLGAGVAKRLFEQIPPDAVVLLRLLTCAVVLVIAGRTAVRRALLVGRPGHRAADLAVAAGFGLSLVVMNYSIYQAFSRIPLGIAVTIEFLGPLTVAIAASRRAVDLLWAALAFAGVALLATGDTAGDPAGVAFALLAGVAWGAYILLSAATGRRYAGSTGLALASVVAAVIALPAGVAAGGMTLLDPRVLLIGVAVGLLSSVIPYTLELEALRRVPARVFGVLMSLEPAVAALIGVIVLGELLAAPEWAAVVLVVIACVGATRAAGRDGGLPAAPEA